VAGFYFLDLAPYDAQSISAASLHPESSSPVALVADTDFLMEPTEKREGVYTSAKFYPSTPVFSSFTASRWGFAYVDLTGTWGFPSVPQDVQDVCIKVVVSWMRRDLGVAAAMAASDLGAVVPPPAAYDLPAFAKRELAGYSRRPNIF
jgi:hypothetical protein